MNFNLNLNSKKGASVTEFLVVAPILALLLYAALDLNQLLEFRQGLIISTRNAAFDKLEKVTLDTANPENLERQIKSFVVPGSEADLGVLTVSTVDQRGFSDDLGFSLDRAAAALKDDQVGNDSTFESTSGTIGSGVATANNLLDRISLATSTEEYWLLPPPNLRTVTGSLSETDGTSLLRKSMNMVSKASENKTDLPGYKSPAMSQMLYLRPENGYHPNGYVVQPLVGYLLGLSDGYVEWGGSDWVASGSEPKNFSHNCLMNFDAGGKNCKDVNLFFLGIRVAGAVLRILITAGKNSGYLTVPSYALDGQTTLLRNAADGAIGVVTNKVSTEVSNKIEGLGNDLVKKSGISGNGINGDFTDPATLFNPASELSNTIMEEMSLEKLSSMNKKK